MTRKLTDIQKVTALGITLWVGGVVLSLAFWGFIIWAVIQLIDILRTAVS